MHVPTLRAARAAACLAVLWWMPGDPGRATAADGNDVWPGLRASLFGQRAIADAGRELQLIVPRRAEDAAVVPIAIRASAAAGAGGWRKVYLIIDKNPSPVSAVFEIDEQIGRVDIETRVRVEDYSTVRAIVEAVDGSLMMTTRDIKAAGGCSAAANKRDADPNSLGQMRWQLPDPVAAGESVPVTLLIRHPNTSGLAMDQVSRLYEPPHFVRQVRVTYRGRQVFRADVDFSISENPAFRFTFRADGDGMLEASVVDSNALQFRSAVPVAPLGR